MFVIYHKESTIIPHTKGKSWQTQAYESERAAKAGLTRAANSGKLKYDKSEYAIADAEDFRDNIEKQVTRINLMSQKPFQEPINTPVYLSPAFESYWSM